MSVIRPVHKKGPRNDILNYRPVSNLCSGSKVWKNILTNRMTVLNNQIEYDWLNKSLWVHKSKLEYNFLIHETGLKPVLSHPLPPATQFRNIIFEAINHLF